MYRVGGEIHQFFRPKMRQNFWRIKLFVFYKLRGVKIIFQTSQSKTFHFAGIQLPDHSSPAVERCPAQIHRQAQTGAQRGTSRYARETSAHYYLSTRPAVA